MSVFFNEIHKILIDKYVNNNNLFFLIFNFILGVDYSYEDIYYRYVHKCSTHDRAFCR